MITRTAVFEGRIKEGFEEKFFREIKDRLAPLWRRFPGAVNVRLLRVRAADDGSPSIVMMQQIDYESSEAVDAALRSPIRAEARAVTLEILEMFDGRFYHLVCDKNSLEP